MVALLFHCLHISQCLLCSAPYLCSSPSSRKMYRVNATSQVTGLRLQPSFTGFRTGPKPRNANRYVFSSFCVCRRIILSRHVINKLRLRFKFDCTSISPVTHQMGLRIFPQRWHRLETTGSRNSLSIHTPKQKRRIWLASNTRLIMIEIPP
jgi:hypothetical protein